MICLIFTLWTLNLLSHVQLGFLSELPHNHSLGIETSVYYVSTFCAFLGLLCLLCNAHTLDTETFDPCEQTFSGLIGFLSELHYDNIPDT